MSLQINTKLKDQTESGLFLCPPKIEYIDVCFNYVKTLRRVLE